MLPPPELNGARKGETMEDYRDRYLSSIPNFIRSQFCSCAPSIKAWHKTQTASPNGLTHAWKNNVGYHWDCGKPSPSWAYIEICFNCEQMYVVKSVPDLMMLCEDCGG